MTCPYGMKFDAFICLMRHKHAVETDGDESHGMFPMCADCNAVKCYINYRSRLFKQQKDNLDKERIEIAKKPNIIRDERGKTVITIRKRKERNALGERSEEPVEEHIDPYILSRFIETYDIVKKDNIKSYDELLRFIRYRSKRSIYIYIRDNRKGLEFLFKNSPFEE